MFQLGKSRSHRALQRYIAVLLAGLIGVTALSYSAFSQSSTEAPVTVEHENEDFTVPVP